MKMYVLGEILPDALLANRGGSAEIAHMTYWQRRIRLFSLEE